jgi:hypothetical protein
MYRIEKIWQEKDYLCAVIFSDMGHRCGYVGITDKHPLFGLNYSDSHACLELDDSWERRSIDDRTPMIPLLCYSFGRPISLDICINVHGGITYADRDSLYPVTNGGLWWFGFDCGHYNDARDFSDPLTHETYRNCYIHQGIIRTLDYCVSECNKMANQLKEIENRWKFHQEIINRQFVWGK